MLHKDWYKLKINYTALVKKERKVLSEYYVVAASSYGNLQDTVEQILQERIKQVDLDAASKFKLNDVYIKPSINGVDSEFYLATVKISGVESTYNEIHLLNASNVDNAYDRVKARMKHTLAPFKVTKVELTKFYGIYDSEDEALEQDFIKRQEHLAAGGFVEAEKVKVSEPIPGTERGYDKINIIESDPNAIAAMVIANDVTEVNAEDLNNGTTTQPTDTLTPVYELPTGNDSPAEGNNLESDKRNNGPFFPEESGEKFPGIQDQYKTPNPSDVDSSPETEINDPETDPDNLDDLVDDPTTYTDEQTEQGDREVQDAINDEYH